MTTRRRPLGAGPQETHARSADPGTVTPHDRVVAATADLGAEPLYRQGSADELDELRARGVFTPQPRSEPQPGRRRRPPE
ncbi:hypothetical protein OG711_38920 (plasmid) [Streptomyces uncialis]|uniref:hypothetical protein n=1 Tax=Streptomyces uncialis TaxID=1048205 RepID=UPI002E3556B9|nr:hypothetical protein [Streptomyces uncialis]